MGCLSSKPKGSSGSSAPASAASSSATKGTPAADKDKGAIGDRIDGTIDEQYILGDELGAPLVIFHQL